jgi:hypothetical protein
VDKAISIGTLCLSVFGVTTWWPFSPLWALLPLSLLFLYGAMKANYKAFQEIDHKNTRLEAKLTTNAKRVALKDALGMAHKRGQRLARIIHERLS